ncbi:MAG: relaxase/mobilization nuclease domain-containing protein, partial [Bacteroidota bacterium]
KLKQNVAELILAENYFKDAHLLNFREKLFMLEHQAKLNERVKANSVHISLSFHPEEMLSKEKLQGIAKSYMDQIGFGHQPYLVYQHHDAGHPHMHIVTTNITVEGKRIDMNNIGRTLSEKARKAIDKEFKLISPESKKVSKQLQQKESTHNEAKLKPVSPRKVEYGKSETKAAIQKVVDHVMNQYKYTSLGEYNAVLKLYNVMADPGQKGSLMHEKKGLVYRVLDEKGNKIGTPIKASQFYNQPTLKNLEIKFKQNEVLRERFALRIRNQIDLAILRNNTLENLSGALRSEGIGVMVRQTNEGKIYGMTFIDYKNQCVFNGSSLGRNYSAQAIQERCMIKAEIVKQEQPLISQKINGSIKNNVDYKKDILAVEKDERIYLKYEPF